MKIILSIIMSFSFLFGYSQTIEEAEKLFYDGDNKEALKVLKKCKNSDAVELLKARVNYELGYDNFACESLKNMQSEEAILLYDSLCVNNHGINMDAVDSEKLLFEEVVQVDSSLSKDDLYLNAKSWFAETFRSAQDVIQMDEEEVGKIIGKGNFKYYSTVFFGSEATKGVIRFTITVQVKDGRYKYVLSDFIHEGNPLSTYGAISLGLITKRLNHSSGVSTTPTQKKLDNIWIDIKEQIESKVPSLISDLKVAMSKTPEYKEDNW